MSGWVVLIFLRYSEMRKDRPQQLTVLCTWWESVYCGIHPCILPPPGPHLFILRRSVLSPRWPTSWHKTLSHTVPSPPPSLIRWLLRSPDDKVPISHRKGTYSRRPASRGPCLLFSSACCICVARTRIVFLLASSSFIKCIAPSVSSCSPLPVSRCFVSSTWTPSICRTLLTSLSVAIVSAKTRIVVPGASRRQSVARFTARRGLYRQCLSHETPDVRRLAMAGTATSMSFPFRTILRGKPLSHQRRERNKIEIRSSVANTAHLDKARLHLAIQSMPYRA